MEIMKMQGEQQQSTHAAHDLSEQRMRKSATVIEFQPTPSVDICPLPADAVFGNANDSPAKAKMMHRQTSLIVFPEDISPSNVEHSRGRWEFRPTRLLASLTLFLSKSAIIHTLVKIIRPSSKRN